MWLGRVSSSDRRQAPHSRICAVIFLVTALRPRRQLLRVLLSSSVLYTCPPHLSVVSPSCDVLLVVCLSEYSIFNDMIWARSDCEKSCESDILAGVGEEFALNEGSSGLECIGHDLGGK